MGNQLNTRIAHKYDTAENWAGAKTSNGEAFKPLPGELIVYAADENSSAPKIKIGDGQKAVNDLPFVGTDEEEIKKVAITLQTPSAIGPAVGCIPVFSNSNTENVTVYSSGISAQTLKNDVNTVANKISSIKQIQHTGKIIYGTSGDFDVEGFARIETSDKYTIGTWVGVITILANNKFEMQRHDNFPLYVYEQTYANFSDDSLHIPLPLPDNTKTVKIVSGTCTLGAAVSTGHNTNIIGWGTAATVKYFNGRNNCALALYALFPDATYETQALVRNQKIFYSVSGIIE